MEGAKTMRAVLVRAPGGPEQLTLGEAPRPELQPGCVLVKIKATSLNRADTLQREGKYPPPPGDSTILGLEMAGIIEDIGPATSGHWKKGDRVCALLGGGGYAEYCVIKEDMAIGIPDNMSFEEAACIPEAFLTAWQSLRWLGGLENGKRVLIHAGASGVGSSAIQLVKQFENTYVYATASRDKLDFCKSLGADDAFDRNDGPWLPKVMQSTENKGVDLVIDFVGSSYWEQNLQVLALDGVMVILALLSGSQTPAFDMGPILRKRLTIRGSTLRNRSIDYKIKLTKDFEAFAMSRFAEGKLKPVIYKVFSWEHVADAHRMMDSNANLGNIVLNGM
jgi:tumor protein p53-inducible protein 3